VPPEEVNWCVDKTEAFELAVAHRLAYKDEWEERSAFAKRKLEATSSATTIGAARYNSPSPPPPCAKATPPSSPGAAAEAPASPLQHSAAVGVAAGRIECFLGGLAGDLERMRCIACSTGPYLYR